MPPERIPNSGDSPLDTSLSLLAGIKQNSNSPSWDEFMAIYEPWMINQLVSRNYSIPDAEDIVQDVMQTILGRIQDFERKRTGSFRKWLRCIMICRASDFNAKFGRSKDYSEILEKLSCDDGDGAKWDRDHDSYVIRKLLLAVEPLFNARMMSVFRQTWIQQRNKQEVADEFGISVNLVYTYRSRVLEALRSIGHDIIDLVDNDELGVHDENAIQDNEPISLRNELQNSDSEPHRNGVSKMVCRKMESRKAVPQKIMRQKMKSRKTVGQKRVNLVCPKLARATLSIRTQQAKIMLSKINNRAQLSMN